MKKICFVTAARSEYGLLKWLMKEVREADGFDLQIVVTGAHLMPEQGHTVDLIREDGFQINEIVDAGMNTESKKSIADSMGKMAQGFSHAFEKLAPDYTVLLGDRYELLPIACTAFVMGIPIIHLSGGDVTEGAIDDGIRNAVTMLATYHFPGTRDSAANIIRMRGSDRNIWAVGEPGIDAFFRETLADRRELAEDLGLDPDSRWVLLTYHAETKESPEYNMKAVKACVSSLLQAEGIQTVATYSNADYGGQRINEYLEAKAAQHPSNLRVIPSLGSRRYLSYMKQVSFVIGNSSSGIVEAPALGVPVVNIGNRQKGRHQCRNVIQTDIQQANIDDAVDTALTANAFDPDHFWGDGHTAERIMSILRKELI